MINNINNNFEAELLENVQSISRLADEFKAFVEAKNTKVKLMDVAAMAYDSYCSHDECEESMTAQLEAGRKCMNLYNALKSSIPKELQNLLFSLDNAYGDQLGLVDQQSYTNGFKDAMKTLNVIDGSVNSNDKH